jgi:hypothetical protein
MAIAEHNPGKLYSRNKGLAKMSHTQLHDFAATKRSGLPNVAAGHKNVRNSRSHQGKLAHG